MCNENINSNNDNINNVCVMCNINVVIMCNGNNIINNNDINNINV